MSALFAKLNLKDQKHIVVLSSPRTFADELSKLPESVKVATTVSARQNVDFAIAFAVTQADVDHAARQLAAGAQGDAILWFAYPKGTSKRYRCEFNRDTGWELLGSLGFEPVRLVAIDEDWSALRFRRVEYIKQMKRTSLRALSAIGKQRIAEDTDKAAISRSGQKPTGAATRPVSSRTKAAPGVPTSRKHVR
jgi:hypothetical protein